jgi:hypothetical protein
MRKFIPIGLVMLAGLPGCGLENVFGNAGHPPTDRPASQISGTASWSGIAATQFEVLDGAGAKITPFQFSLGGGGYSLQLPSSKYSMTRVQARAGHLLLRTLVPFVGPESSVSNASLDARGVTEDLLLEAWLSANDKPFGLISPAAYEEPGTGAGARKFVRDAFDAAAPTADQQKVQVVLHMVERLIAAGNPNSGDPLPGFFLVPVAATGVLTIGGTFDYPFAAGSTITVTVPHPSGTPTVVTLTAGTDFVPGATDATSAKALAKAINEHLVLKGIVSAKAVEGARWLDSTVTLSARTTGEPGNLIATTTSDLHATWAHATLTGGISPVSSPWLKDQKDSGTPVDYTGDGTADTTNVAFDAALDEAVKAVSYKPEGCPDPTRIRLVFTVDFNQGALSGSCGPLNRFLWTTDKPGKQMFFVGWVHKESDIQSTAVGKLLGNAIPNVLPMYDDGTNGDEAAGDGIYTITFDVPRDPAEVKKLRLGYKYTWGFQGQQWNGSEEWPGNSRIIQVDDMNGDGFVYRRDVYQDEASNKDKANMNLNSAGGSIDWATDLKRCDPAHPLPEARENRFVNKSPGNMCLCSGANFYTPPNLGSINVACR